MSENHTLTVLAWMWAISSFCYGICYMSIRRMVFFAVASLGVFLTLLFLIAFATGRLH